MLQSKIGVKAFKQKASIDYFEVFAPVTRLDIVRMIISITANTFWKIYQMDMKSAFLNGIFEEEVYIEPPAGYVKKG